MASFSLLKKILADFSSSLYLLTLLLKTRNKSYKIPLAHILTRPEIRLHNFKHYVQK